MTTHPDEFEIEVEARPIMGSIHQVDGSPYEVTNIEEIYGHYRVRLTRRTRPVDGITLYAQACALVARLSKRKPQCAQCWRKVDDVFAEVVASERRVHFQVRCHGDEETFSIPFAILPSIDPDDLREAFLPDGLPSIVKRRIP